MIYTTLNRIRAHQPCAGGWAKLLAHLGKTKADDDPLSYSTIVEATGLVGALWCCRAEPQHGRVWRLFAVWCARQVAHLNSNPRSLDALDIAERFANGDASEIELAAASAAARAAALAASAAAFAASADVSAEDAAALASMAASDAQSAEFLRLLES